MKIAMLKKSLVIIFRSKLSIFTKKKVDRLRFYPKSHLNKKKSIGKFNILCFPLPLSDYDDRITCGAS